MAALVIINDGCGLEVEACRRSQSNKSKLLLYKPLFSLEHSFKTAVHKQQDGALELRIYVDGCSMHGRMCIETFKKELVWAIDKWLQVISNKMLFKTVILLRN